MNERYTRQTYKNLLNMGSTALAHNQPINGNENIQTMINNKMNVNHTQVSNLKVSSGTTTTSVQQTLVTSQTFSSQMNLRNALGDIGNRIGSTVSLNQFAKKETILKPVTVQAVSNEAKEAKPVPVQITTEQSKNENNNNSCIMIDDDEDNDVEEIIEDEESMNKSELLDIDAFDTENTQLVAEYVKDIYNYLTLMEKKNRISTSFLDNKIVTSKMRAVLIDWLIQVHLKFHLLQETLYLCVQIIDAYLEAVDVQKMQLQLVGVTAMFVASKYEEMYVPAIDDFVYMTDNTYTKSEIRQMEISILKTLNFTFGKPLPLHFLRRFSKAGQADPKQHTLAKYFMELSLHESEFSSMDPSYLAASSLCLSFKLLNGTHWNRTLEHYSNHKQSSLWVGMHKISKLVLKATDFDYKYRAATNKYGASKFMRISLLPELHGPIIRELAAGNF